MPRHTSHYGWEASRPTREPSRQFVYAQACVNRRTRHGATAFRRDPGEIPPTAYAPAYVVHQTEDIPHHPETAIPTCVCPRIRHTTDTRRSTPAWDRNAGLRMPRHTQTAEHGTARPLSGEIRPTAYAPAYRMRRKPEQQSKLPPDTHAPPQKKRKEAEARMCRASASLVDRRLPVLAYRFRRSRPYRPVLALT